MVQWSIIRSSYATIMSAQLGLIHGVLVKLFFILYDFMRVAWCISFVVKTRLVIKICAGVAQTHSPATPATLLSLKSNGAATTTLSNTPLATG